MKKRILAFLLIYVLLSSPVFADPPVIINGNFEDSTVPFIDMVQSSDEPFSGNYCALLQAPLQYSDTKGVYRESAYLYSLSLEAGKLYELNMAVRSTVPSLSEAVLKTDYDYNAKRITLDISGLSSSWQTVRQMFVAGSQGDYEMVINFFDSEFSDGVYIDELTVEESDTLPVSMQIEGARNVFIPDYGETQYRYSAMAVDENGFDIPVIVSKITAGSLPEGMYFSEETNTLTVTPSARAGESFTMYATLPYGPSDLSEVSITVTADKNYIENGSFTDLPVLNGFETDHGSLSAVERNGSIHARIETVEQDENLFTATLSISKTYLITPGITYVLRAKLYSEEGYISRLTQSSESLVSSDGTIYINISNVGYEEREVMTAVEVSSEGIYQIKINFYNPDSRPVYIKSLGLYAEELKPSEVLISAPSHITIPEDGSLSVPLSFAVRDQAGNFLAGIPVSSRVEPESAGVRTEGANLTVSSDASEGQYRICASADNYGGLAAYFTVDIDHIAIGDGSFESFSAYQKYQTADPSVLNISTSYHGNYPADGTKFAKLTFNGSVSAVLADSVYKFDAGKAYVFDAYIKKTVPDIDTVVTVLVYNTDTSSFDESLAVLQFALTDSPDIKRVFVPVSDITGRIMIAFNTPYEHTDQVVLLDSLDIKKAQVYATDVTISGYPYPYRDLTGKSRFYSNFETSEFSTYKWLAAPTEDGVYIPIEGETDQTLSVTEDLVGKYIKYEVTPASLNGPVYGESVTSAPLQIMAMTDDDKTTQYISTAPVKQDNEANESVPENSNYNNPATIDKGGALSVVNIYSPAFTASGGFFDTVNHWAEEDIKIMSAANIVNGRGNMLFSPDDLITRAEFSALLIRSFSLAPLLYTGAFTDVKKSNWYSGVVETVTKYNIANGIGEGLFAPDAPLTREQLSVMIVRAIKLTGVHSIQSKPLVFDDASDISPWAKEAIESASGMELIMGMPDNSFAPKRNCTRAEATVMIKRMISFVISN